MDDFLSDTFIGEDFEGEVESEWLLKVDQNGQIEDDLPELDPTLSGRRDRTVVDSQDSGYLTDPESQLFSLENLESTCIKSDDGLLMTQMPTDPSQILDGCSETSLTVGELQLLQSQQDEFTSLPEENPDIFNIQLIIGNMPHGMDPFEAVSIQDDLQAIFGVNPSDEINTQEGIVQERESPCLGLATEPMESSSYVPEPPKRRGRGRPRKLNPKPKVPKKMKWQDPENNKGAFRERQKREKKKVENINRENEILRLQNENETLLAENADLRKKNANLSQELQLVRAKKA